MIYRNANLYNIKIRSKKQKTYHIKPTLAMTFYNFYIFNRKGVCLFYKEWNRPLYTLQDDPDEDRKLMFGMLFSLKDLTAKMSPEVSTQGIHTVKTPNYTIHHYESLSGISFVLNTDPSIPDMYDKLFHIYSKIFVDCVNKNILNYNYKIGDVIDCPIFSQSVENYLQSL